MPHPSKGIGGWLVGACGRAARAAGSVAFAVGDSAMAGASAHRSLIFA